MEKIPVVDIGPIMTKKNVGESEESWTHSAQEIFNALSGIGFVYLKNHGVPSEVISRAFQESKLFFEQPVEVKMKSLKDISKSFNGYAALGQETLHPDTRFEVRESYDVNGNLRYFPDETCPSFGPALSSLEEGSKPLIITLLRLLEKALELDDDGFFVERSTNLKDINVGSFTTFRSLYYPPVWQTNIGPGTVRCGDHSDYGTLTLLFQDDMGGLEVKAVSGQWVKADPIPGTILVNTGDLLEFWSGGVFPATHHRVLIPEEEIRQKCARQSMVFFIHPDNDVVIKPLNQARNQDDNYEPVTAKRHAEMRLNASYNY